MYYLSRTLVDVETWYSPIEKLCLPLYFSCTELKYYLIPWDVFIISQINVMKYMFSSPMLHNKDGKWMLVSSHKIFTAFCPSQSSKGTGFGWFLSRQPGDCNRRSKLNRNKILEVVLRWLKAPKRCWNWNYACIPYGRTDQIPVQIVSRYIDFQMYHFGQTDRYIEMERVQIFYNITYFEVLIIIEIIISLWILNLIMAVNRYDWDWLATCLTFKIY